MKNILKWVWSFLQGIIIIYVIVITAYILCKNKYGYTQFGDYTLYTVNASDVENLPKTKDGDLLVVKKGTDIKRGDIVYFYSIDEETYIVKSDVILEVKKDGNLSTYTINQDNPITISNNHLIGRKAVVYRNVGKFLATIEDSTGFLLLVLLPILIVFIYQVIVFIILLRNDHKENSIKQTNSNDENGNDIVNENKELIKEKEQEKQVTEQLPISEEREENSLNLEKETKTENSIDNPNNITNVEEDNNSESEKQSILSQDDDIEIL